MDTFLSIVIFASSIILIVSVVFQEGKDAGMGSTLGGSSDKLFGKGSAKGMQAILQRSTIISAAVFMVVTFIMSAVAQ